MYDPRKKRPEQPPKWFTTYMEAFEKKIDQKIYDAVNNPPQPPKWFRDFAIKQEKFNKEILARLDGIVKANNLIDPSSKSNSARN